MSSIAWDTHTCNPCIHWLTFLVILGSLIDHWLLQPCVYIYCAWSGGVNSCTWPWTPGPKAHPGVPMHTYNKALQSPNRHAARKGAVGTGNMSYFVQADTCIITLKLVLKHPVCAYPQIVLASYQNEVAIAVLSLSCLCQDLGFHILYLQYRMSPEIDELTGSWARDKRMHSLP